MGMTIDKAIKQLETYSIPCGKYKAAYDLAIETMRKYQKIQEIVARWKVDTWTDGVSYDCMTQISEVVEDGND